MMSSPSPSPSASISVDLLSQKLKQPKSNSSHEHEHDHPQETQAINQAIASESNPTPNPTMNPTMRSDTDLKTVAPQPSSISTVSANHQFQLPRKRIISTTHLDKFKQSDALNDILTFIQVCNDSIVGKKLRDQDVAVSQVVESILSILSKVSQLVKETPPESNSNSRFGNPAFRTLYAKIKERLADWLEEIPGVKKSTSTSTSTSHSKSSIPTKDETQQEQEEEEKGGIGPLEEISVYFQESWGNEKRIDYGSGMELNFLCWLLCLTKLQILRLETDSQAIVLKIFWKYISVMREIQSTYWLEPAGSHGVWGLDDYHFLPFLWGSGQLKNHKHLRPKSIHDDEIMEEFSPDYMYFACIRFINSIKTASLRWHSPMLDDISSVKTWPKVNEGMMKMYKAEVLYKLPISQHIFFGSLISYPSDQDEEGEGEREEEEEAEVQEDEHGHIHPHANLNPNVGGAKEGQAAGWGDCCGIPIPSVFAAANEEKEKSKVQSAFALGQKPIFGNRETNLNSNVRRIPFD